MRDRPLLSAFVPGPQLCYSNQFSPLVIIGTISSHHRYSRHHSSRNICKATSLDVERVRCLAQHTHNLVISCAAASIDLCSTPEPALRKSKGEGRRWFCSRVAQQYSSQDGYSSFNSLLFLGSCCELLNSPK